VSSHASSARKHKPIQVHRPEPISRTKPHKPPQATSQSMLAPNHTWTGHACARLLCLGMGPRYHCTRKSCHPQCIICCCRIRVVKGRVYGYLALPRTHAIPAPHRPQALRKLPLQHLELAEHVFDHHSSDSLAPFLPPSLTSLASNSVLSLIPEAVSRMLPHQLLITSLDITVAGHGTMAAAALDVLGGQLPQLTSLRLAAPAAFGQGRRPVLRGVSPRLVLPNSVQGGGHASHASNLSQLSKLQRLSIGSQVVAHCLMPGLSTLPELTRLELADAVDGQDLQWLPGLRRLKSLHLAVRPFHQFGEVVDELAAARQLQGLTELGLLVQQSPGGPSSRYLRTFGDAWGTRQPPGRWDLLAQRLREHSRGARSGAQPVFAGLLPVPVLLRRLVVPRPMLQAALEALGWCVDDVCAAEA
jgi:hypothetical protein